MTSISNDNADVPTDLYDGLPPVRRKPRPSPILTGLTSIAIAAVAVAVMINFNWLAVPIIVILLTVVAIAAFGSDEYEIVE